MLTIDKTAQKFRDMAAKLEGEIAGKRADRRSNTQKQCKEAHAARIEADHLERIKTALECLADAREAETLPEALASITSKTQLASMLKTRIDTPSYYLLCDTGEFRDQSDTAKALRSFMEASRSEANKADDAAREAKNKIAALERDVKFRPIPSFFPTPMELVVAMVLKADLHAWMRVLEPSAGKGDIAVAARAAGAEVHVCEINRTLQDILAAKGFQTIGDNFLECGSPLLPYDRVLMNPPFENGQDIDHVRHAYGFLKEGGRLVSIMSAGPFFRSDKKSVAFREWFEQVNGEAEDLSDGAFNGAFRSTGVKTRLVVIES